MDDAAGEPLVIASMVLFNSIDVICDFSGFSSLGVWGLVSLDNNRRFRDSTN
jgi:hypothetical protein